MNDVSSDAATSRGLSFGTVAGAYERSRPGYPAEAVRWLIGDRPRRVIDLGAGTGKLTRDLVAYGHNVVAVEPSGPMLVQLRQVLPSTDARQGTAESIPAEDASFDVVVMAQAFHWVDREVAVPEIARVLRPGGRLALVWNLRDESERWVHDLWQVIAPDEPREIVSAELPPGSPFGPWEQATFRHTQPVDRDTTLELALSRSYVASRPTAERADLLARAGRIFDSHAGDDAILPYLTHCYRAKRQ